MTRSPIRAVVGALGALVVSLTVIVAPAAAPAADAAPPISDFDPGYIISDRNFFDAGSMSEADIQNFLNAKVPNCAAGAVCLKDFTQVTRPLTSESCAPFTPDAGPESAARIIWKAAQLCGISPKVILVTLQKEQGLITATNPSARAYRYAMGADCPDSIGCTDTSAGFVVQIYRGTYHLKRYTVQPDMLKAYPVGVVSKILLKPAPSTCGTQDVFIRNLATHALYVYTPYVPNAAAMNNLYGLGDGCSSYGNRNFWRNYYDWFGDPQGGDPSFIVAIFVDFLGRTPDDAAIRAWDWLLQSGRTRASLAADIVYSEEYRAARISDAYYQQLGRAPDATGLAYWLSVTRRGGLPIDEVSHYFLRSDEYYASIGGSPEQFVESVYQTMLARSATATDQEYWAPIVAEHGREAVVWAIYNSPESSYRRVNAMYQKLLARDADENGKLYWGPLVVARGDNEIRAALVDSVEYADRAKARFPIS
ncbi:MAG: DUF4214 domain-containing protein [Protaetiibacter sp.]